MGLRDFLERVVGGAGGSGSDSAGDTGGRTRSRRRSRRQPKLGQAPQHAVDIAARTLQVSTAEGMVIVVLDQEAAAALQETLARDESAALHGPAGAGKPAGEVVYFVPTWRAALAVHDPRYGWAVPVDGEERVGIAKLGTAPQEVEVSARLGLVIEETPRP
ncbi:hypothetical protein [Corynebacterium massiliense]|uniref:hypothetical protein n=1 Tax=Corynebacterium massiliense TaxID=441501 RepID=UPI0012EBF818|nr:hypothetical protein [Corynebacterium massiliense]